MKPITTFVAGLAALLASGVALAHPGHEIASFATGFAHPLSGMDHRLAMLAVGAWAMQSGGRVLWAAPLAFVVAMLAGSLLGLAGLSVPLVEPMIAASVLVLGLLVALRATLGQRLSRVLPLLAVFAAFHGIAHGAEFSGLAEGSVAAYVPGFVLATALLHGLGMLAGLALRGDAFKARLAGAPIALAGAALLVQALPA